MTTLKTRDVINVRPLSRNRGIILIKKEIVEIVPCYYLTPGSCPVIVKHDMLDSQTFIPSIGCGYWCGIHIAHCSIVFNRFWNETFPCE